MDREVLLRRPLVAVYAVARPDGRVHATPLWFHWDGRDFNLIVNRGSPRHRWSVASGRGTICIETDDAGELSFVTAEGPVTVVDPLTRETRFQMWERYRGAEHAHRVVDAGGHETRVLLQLRPESWISST